MAKMVTSKERQRLRELAMQVMFAWDAAGHADEGSARQIAQDGSENPVVRQLALELAGGAWEQREMIDQRIERFAPNWPPRRQAGVDRNLLRLAVYELTNRDLLPEIVIDTYITIAQDYSTSSSSAFLNGVLDAIVKEHVALVAGLPTAASSSGTAGEDVSAAGAERTTPQPPAPGDGPGGPEPVTE